MLLGTIAIFFISLLYSSVGHAGASGYLAVMALIGTAPGVMRPVALALNLLVAAIGSRTFIRAGHLDWPLLWPLLVTSVPMAYLGGHLALPVPVYRPVIGIILLLSAARFLVQAKASDVVRRRPARPVTLFTGGVLGFLAGLTGVGGGIFLSPLLLFCGWATLRTTAATSVVFILANSAAGLLGQAGAMSTWPPEVIPWGAAVVVGGTLGSHLGARRLPSAAIRLALAAVLLLAGVKLVWA